MVIKNDSSVKQSHILIAEVLETMVILPFHDKKGPSVSLLAKRGVKSLRILGFEPLHLLSGGAYLGHGRKFV